jgi:hypothetical protein
LHPTRHSPFFASLTGIFNPPSFIDHFGGRVNFNVILTGRLQNQTGQTMKASNVSDRSASSLRSIEHPFRRIIASSRKLWVAFAVLIPLLSSCALTDQGTPEILVMVEPTASTYQIADTSRIYLTINNRAKSPVSYNTCGAVEVSELVNSQVGRTFTTADGCYCNCIVVVEAGTQAVFSLGVLRLLAGGTAPDEAAEDVEYLVAPVLFSGTNIQDQLGREMIQIKSLRLRY